MIFTFMKKSIFSWIKKYWQVFFIFIATLFAYGLSTQMFFWVDDWGLTYKMIFPYDAPDPSNFGGGFWGTGAYRHNATPFIFLYPLFGLSAPIYFTLGVLQYFITAWLLYSFVNCVTKNKMLALMTGIIFASGYFGSYAIYRLSNSYQLIETAIFLILTSWALVKHFQTKKIGWYWISMLLFIITLEFFFLRAHGIGLIILGCFLFLTNFKDIKKSLLLNLIKLVPFIALYYYFYIIDYRGGSESGYNGSTYFLSLFINEVFVKNNWSLILNPFASFANLLIPTPVIELIYKYISHTLFPNVDSFSKLLGTTLMVVTALVCVKALKAKKNEWRLIPFSIIWIFSNIAIYYIYMPNSVFVSSSRYAIPAFVGSSILLSTTLYLLFSKRIAMIFTLIISIVLIYLTNRDELYIIRQVSVHDKQGYDLIKKVVPKVDKDTLFFVDILNDPEYKSNVLGGIPTLGISSFYKYHGNTQIANSYNETFDLINKGKADINKTYTFFFSRDGYVNTTDKFREILKKGNELINLTWKSLTPKTETLVYQRDFGMVGVNPTLEAEFNYPSLSTSVLTIDVAVKPLGVHELKFPYYDMSKVFDGQGITNINLAAIPKLDINEIKKDDVVNLIQLAKERNDFIQKSKIDSKTYEQDKKPEFMIDGTNNYGWEANYFSWKKNNQTPEEIVIDLGTKKSVKNIYWVNHSPSATLSDYSFSVSDDNKNWKLIKRTTNIIEKKSQEVIEENLNVSTRYIKMNIYKTLNIDAVPAIDELWVSNYENGNQLNSVTSSMAIDCPLCFSPDKTFAQAVIEAQRGSLSGKLWWITNGQDNYSDDFSKKITLNMDGKVHTYKILIPASGSQFKKIKIGNFPIPVKIDIFKATIKNLSLQEMNEL